MAVQKPTYTKAFIADIKGAPSEVKEHLTNFLEECSRVAFKKRDAFVAIPYVDPDDESRTVGYEEFYSGWTLVFSGKKFLETCIMLGPSKDIEMRLELSPGTLKPTAKFHVANPELVLGPEPDNDAEFEALTTSNPPHRDPKLRYTFTKDHFLALNPPRPDLCNMAGTYTTDSLVTSFTTTVIERDVLLQLLRLARGTGYSEAVQTGRMRTPDDGPLDFQRLDRMLLDLDKHQQTAINGLLDKNGCLVHSSVLIEGGPGTGKSVLGWHLLRAALDGIWRRNKEQFGTTDNIRVLLTTFTKSLTAVAKAELHKIIPEEQVGCVDVVHINMVARGLNTRAGLHQQARYKYDWDLEEIVAALIKYDSSFMDLRKYALMPRFIVDHIKWSIINEQCETEEEYLKADAHGVGPLLGKKNSNLRLQIWMIWKKLKSLEELPIQYQLVEARENINESTSKYDLIFIDEAQDLQGPGLRLCDSLLKDGGHLISLGDENQALFSPMIKMNLFFRWWKPVKGILVKSVLNRVPGWKSDKTYQVHLQQNHRCTQQIVSAVRDVAMGLGRTFNVDEWLGAPNAKGHRPRLMRFDDADENVQEIIKFIEEKSHQECTNPRSASVLCIGGDQGHKLANAIKRERPEWNPKYMGSSDYAKKASDHRGLVVMSIHAAKGLDLPIAVLSGVDPEGWVDLYANVDVLDGFDHELQDYFKAKQERVLLTGLTRAAKHLMVTAPSGANVLIDRLHDSESWDICKARKLEVTRKTKLKKSESTGDLFA